MVRVPYIKIPNVRVGSIGPASNIGTGGATPAPPTPVTYLTQWKIVGNSQVHTDPYLTSWKVSGNSVVDNNTILSCGDLGQDGKYHVKISNGVTIFDIPLTEPLRKVNDVADTIEFPSGTEGKALVTRNIDSQNLGNYNYKMISAGDNYRAIATTQLPNIKTVSISALANILCASYTTITSSSTSGGTTTGIALSSQGNIVVYDDDYNQEDSASAFKTHVSGVELIYELATPTTELVDAPQIAVSPTDTYTSANVTPYSAFEHTENKEIWSCGEYSAVDGKYHILVQPLGGSIADIALDEPLRKVNDVADTIEFPSNAEGKALVTRRIASSDLGTLGFVISSTSVAYTYRIQSNALNNVIAKVRTSNTRGNIICAIYNTITSTNTWDAAAVGIAVNTVGILIIYDDNYNQSTDTNAFLEHINGVEFIYELATPTTELVDAPQIEEADSYTCVISQGGKAVSWSSFETD